MTYQVMEEVHNNSARSTQGLSMGEGLRQLAAVNGHISVVAGHITKCKDFYPKSCVLAGNIAGEEATVLLNSTNSSSMLICF